jgi:hypothetical protein
MKQQINEFKRMQLIAGLITESEYRESLLNEDSLEKTISFGPYTNLTYYDHPREDTAYLVVDTSDNFTKIARAVDTKGKDFYTKKQILYLNDKLEDLADEMSDYLTKQGIENEVVDSPEGYGQEIDNLEIEISKDDLSKLRMTESQIDEAENKLSLEEKLKGWVEFNAGGYVDTSDMEDEDKDKFERELNTLLQNTLRKLDSDPSLKDKILKNFVDNSLDIVAEYSMGNYGDSTSFSPEEYKEGFYKFISKDDPISSFYDMN